MEIAGQLGRIAHFRAQVGGLGLEFLEADQVGVLVFQPGIQAFAGGGADSVKIQADDAHVIRVLKCKVSRVSSSISPFASRCCCSANSRPRPGA
jgi:hypothetical protein